MISSKLKEKPPGILRGVFRIFDLLVRLRILHEQMAYLPEKIFVFKNKFKNFDVEKMCSGREHLIKKI